MATRNPPSFLQAGSHPAEHDRLTLLRALMNPAGAPASGAGHGVGFAANDLKVQALATPAMSVEVLSGFAFIAGTEATFQGTYSVVNDGTVTLTIAASDATNPRKDLVVAKVQDAAYSGATNAWALAVVTGTPAPSPVEPTVPANAIVLALVDVAAGVASIVNANITDRRRRAVGLGGVGVVTSATRPANPYEGQHVFETDTNKLVGFGGTDWAPRDAGGQLGYAQVTANGAAISAETDITGLSAAVTVGTGRRVRISTEIGFDRTAADGLTRLRIQEGATILVFRDGFVRAATEGAVALVASVVITPSAGAHTYKLVLERVTGTGTTRVAAGTTFPSYILVEDIGAA